MGFVLVDGRGIIGFLDPGAAYFLKVPIDKAVGRKFTEIFPGTRILEVFTGGQQIVQEQHFSEAKVQIHYHPIYINGGIHSIFVLLERTDPECGSEHLDTLQVLNELYEGILDDLPLGMAVVDPQGRLVLANNKYCELLGFEAEKVLGRRIQDVVPFTRLPEVLHSGERIVNSGFRFRGHTLFLSEMPIKHGGTTLGGLSKILSKDTMAGQNLDDLLERFQLLEGRLDFYKGELQELRRSLSPFDDIVGETAELKRLKQMAQRIARGEANVLITGESGTGKGLFAQAIHEASPRCGEPFIKINCAAIPENLLESELFGYEEGAFTGAVRGGRPGKFELGHGGTVFLDEIGDMPLAMQAKILRVLQEKSLERVGGSRTLTVDVRIIAATHRDLTKLIEEQKFRLDLYYRLAVINLHIPPLRERPEDIRPLVQRLINKLNLKYGQRVREVSPSVEECLLAYGWPGNVRELENAIEHAFNFLDEGEEVIALEHLPPALLNKSNRDRDCSFGLNEAVAAAESEAIRQALRLAKGNKQEAARLLGIHPSGLYQKLKKYSIET